MSILAELAIISSEIVAGIGGSNSKVRGIPTKVYGISILTLQKDRAEFS
jgi:hypothetical protein